MAAVLDIRTLVLIYVGINIGQTAHHADLSEVLAIADAALYRAKATGRNRVVKASDQK